MGLPHVITKGVIESDKAAQAFQQNFEELDGRLARLSNPGKTPDSGNPLPNVFDLSIDDAPVNPEAGTLRIYVRDNGAGKAQLVVKDSSGVVTVLATET
jgi:hypothetical protein